MHKISNVSLGWKEMPLLNNLFVPLKESKEEDGGGGMDRQMEESVAKEDNKDAGEPKSEEGEEEQRKDKKEEDQPKDLQENEVSAAVMFGLSLCLCGKVVNFLPHGLYRKKHAPSV